MKVPKKAKFWILFILCMGGCVLLYLAISHLAWVSEPSISVFVTPVNAKITIDGEEFKNGEYRISSGKKKVSISADGFESIDEEIDVKSWHSFRLHRYLKPSDGDYSRYLKSSDSYSILNSLSDLDKEAKDFLSKSNQKMTISDILPIVETDEGVFYRVYLDEGNSNCLEFFCLKIETNADSLDGLKHLVSSYGYNLDDYSYYKESVEN